MTNVLLGYCDKVTEDSSTVESYLQSRCGGLPGWLRPEGLEDSDKFVCDHCRTPLIFILQVYCPREDARTFHRMLYVFACWHCGKTVRCLRQIATFDYGRLPLSPEDPDGEERLTQLQTELAEAVGLCTLCHIPCSAAVSVDGFRYHQHCSNFVFNLTSQSPVRKRYDLGISTEAWEDYFLDLSEEEDQPHTEDDSTFVKPPLSTLAAALKQNSNYEDRVLDRYIEIMNKFPGHVIAYGGLEPVWFCSTDQLRDHQSCENCGKKLKFEFQIQSSLVDKLELTSDLEFGFGILAIYTCPDDCEISREEFIYKQRDPTIEVHIRLKEDLI